MVWKSAFLSVSLEGLCCIGPFCFGVFIPMSLVFVSDSLFILPMICYDFFSYAYDMLNICSQQQPNVFFPCCFWIPCSFNVVFSFKKGTTIFQQRFFFGVSSLKIRQNAIYSKKTYIKHHFQKIGGFVVLLQAPNLFTQKV